MKAAEDEVEAAKKALDTLEGIRYGPSGATTGATGAANISAATGPVEMPSQRRKPVFFDDSVESFAKSIVDRLQMVDAADKDDYNELVTPMEEALATKVAGMLMKNAEDNSSSTKTETSERAEKAASSFVHASLLLKPADEAVRNTRKKLDALGKILATEVRTTKSGLRAMDWSQLTHADAMQRASELQAKSGASTALVKRTASDAVKLGKASQAAMRELEAAAAAQSVQDILVLSEPLFKRISELQDRALRTEADAWRSRDAVHEAEKTSDYASSYLKDAALWSTKAAQVHIEAAQYDAAAKEMGVGKAEQ